MIGTKVSTPPFDIQRSKGIVQILHDIRDGDTNLSLGIQQSLAKYQCLNFCLNGKFSQGFCLRRFFLKIDVSQMIEAQAPW